MFLIANDDGIHAEGLHALEKGLANAGYEFRVLAPLQDRSGASSALTLDRPLQLKQYESRRYSLNGTPADCVHIGVAAMFKDQSLERVLSGINAGANLGDDVLYSGVTVAAALEGRCLSQIRLPFHWSVISTLIRPLAFDRVLTKVE